MLFSSLNFLFAIGCINATKNNEMIRVCTIVVLFFILLFTILLLSVCISATKNNKILEVCTIIWFTLIVQSKIINTVFHY